MSKFSYFKNHWDISFINTKCFICIHFHTYQNIHSFWIHAIQSNFISLNISKHYHLNLDNHLLASYFYLQSEPSHCTNVNKIFNIESKVQYLQAKKVQCPKKSPYDPLRSLGKNFRNLKIWKVTLMTRAFFSLRLPAGMRSLWNISCEKIYIFIRPHTIETL